MRPGIILFILLAFAFGQTSQIPYDPIGGGPTFSNIQAHYSYPGSYSSVRSVNFRSFRFPKFDDAGRPAGSFFLRNGRYKHNEPFNHESIQLESIYYLRGSSSSNEDSALVLLSWFTAAGSSSQGGIAKVFALSGGHLRIIQEMGWDTHFQAGQPTDSFEASTNTLVVRTAHYIPGDAHCCVSAMDVVTLRWDGIHFAQTSIETELSQYGKEERKTLPR